MILLPALLALSYELSAQQPAVSSTPFHVVALAERGGVHQPYVDAAKVWLAVESKRDNFTIEYLEDTKTLTADLLSHTQLVLQLNYPPYNWTPEAAKAFTRYIEEGQGGWIGMHHATLLGEFDGFPLWTWFSSFMGGIRFTSYVPGFATASVHNEASDDPVMRGLPRQFTIENEEWYTYDRSPRPNVKVLASVDEATYVPDTHDAKRTPKMGGDHPVIWTNPHVKARNVYIFMGHHAELFRDPNYTTLVHNAILWAASR